jgi:hypothetical protein
LGGNRPEKPADQQNQSTYPERKPGVPYESKPVQFRYPQAALHLQPFPTVTPIIQTASDANISDIKTRWGCEPPLGLPSSGNTGKNQKAIMDAMVSVSQTGAVPIPTSTLMKPNMR